VTKRLTDGEPEARALVVMRVIYFDFAEGLKYEHLLLIGDPDTAVAHLDAQLRCRAFSLQ